MSFIWTEHFPYPQAREIQALALESLANNWDKYDVFVVTAPTAFGKTALARTLMNAQYSVSCIAPTNLLVDQFIAEFPATRTLHKQDFYWCDYWGRPSIVTKKKMGGCIQKCAGCTQMGKDISQAIYKKGPGIYNYHVYLARELYRDVLVVDEAHNLIPVIRDRLALQMWQHDWHYSDDMHSLGQMQKWARTFTPSGRRTKAGHAFLEAVTHPAPYYVVERTRDWFNGKGTKRGEPELRDCIKLLPVDVSNAWPMFWPNEVQKIVLMSATIGKKDIQQLGLGKKRVCYIDCRSPIPVSSRPIVIMNSVSVNRNTMEAAVEVLVREIQDLANCHTGEKGVIHATYHLSNILQGKLSGDRYMFHDRDSKRDQYQKFRESPPSEGKILVACGMYEGIDLPDDLGRWQVISKIPWQSLGSPAISHLADSDPEWYVWETLKTVIQACGRICRTPTDTGITYILDSTFDRLYSEGQHMIPEWWSEALINKENWFIS